MTEVAPDTVAAAWAGELDDVALVTELRRLRESALELEVAYAAELHVIGDEERASARNLVHYLAVRQHELRGLQRALAERG